MTPKIRNWLTAPIAIALISIVVAAPATGAEEPVAGSQGIDTSLPETDSAITVSGRGDFAALEVSVNQTRNLTDQAVSITWEGGEETIQGPGRFAGNFLQIFQCWGDDDGSVAGNPGPPPEQCAQGATTGQYSGVPAAALPAGIATTRIISTSDWPNFDPDAGNLDTQTGVVWRPFRAVDGTVINRHVDPTFTPSRPGGSYWLNPYFSIVTTNESAASATASNGRGAELFQVATGLQSSGLGCGQRVQRVGGDVRIPRCWLVVVPRGTPADENTGTPFAERAENFGVYTSPVAPEAWANRIAIPLEFNPVDSPCSLADDDRRIAGNELAAPAIANWQPALCSGGDRPPYSYAPVGDSTARGFVLRPATGTAGMSVVQKPIEPSLVQQTNPVVYAPLTVSGLTIGFNVERIPRFDAGADFQALAGVRVADINLTPRLVAKLLTQSYGRQLEIFEPPDYEWLPGNPAHLANDPDFLQFNPEFAVLEIFEGRTFSGLQLPAGNSDAAEQVWSWVLSDPEAAAWLAGTADQWGMNVNPAYATDPAINTTGFPFGTPLPNSFPKADPYCYRAESATGAVAPPLCGTDWMPYARSYAETASRTRRAFDSARIAFNPAAVSSSQVWGGTTPQIIGRRSVLSLTDTPSAAQYGLQSARLSRAGDNGPGRAFISPDAAGLGSGLAAMVPAAVPEVLVPGSGLVEGSYPLTTLTYAAIAPLSLDAQARQEYAAFLDFAASAGQVPSTGFGGLPAGYVPLSSALKDQTRGAAKAVRELQLPAPPTSPAPPASPAASPPTAPEAAPSDAQPAINEDPPTPASNTRSPSGRAATGSAPTTTVAQSAAVPTSDPATEVPPTAEAIPEAVVVEEEEDRAATATPAQGAPIGRVAVPALGVTALASALLALELTKRPRRSFAPAGAPAKAGG